MPRNDSWVVQLDAATLCGTSTFQLESLDCTGGVDIIDGGSSSFQPPDIIDGGSSGFQPPDIIDGGASDTEPSPNESRQIECVACLTAPPDGLGLPSLRTNDTAYLSRDGVQHHADWYEPRTVTLRVSVSDGSCGCGDARQAVQDVLNAWKRMCSGDKELVIWPPCATDSPCASGSERAIYGPYGIVGRGRAASVQWVGGGVGNVALVNLRFDAVDEKMYLLDCCGVPGSGGGSVVLTPDVDILCRTYPRCYPMCYDSSSRSVTGVGPQEIQVDGTECLSPTIRLVGSLSSPLIESVDTGETVQYDSTISEFGSVIINLGDGTASDEASGVDLTARLVGSISLQPGAQTLAMRSFNPDDSGYAVVSWRPAVVTA